MFMPTDNIIDRLINWSIL